jgi:sulfoxide reductase catalytic subunit YedY
MQHRSLPEPFAGHGPTDQAVFFNRRAFLKAACSIGLFGGPAACALAEGEQEALVQAPFARPGVFPAKRVEEPGLPNGVGTRLTPRREAARHNNFYEFLPGRGGEVWKHVGDFEVEPWTLEVRGECHKPMSLDLDDLFSFDHEERLYHFRCVERWAMNVPWTGFPLHKLLGKVEPTSHAKFVRFTTAKRPKQMPGLRTTPNYPWPYQEALRIDEAMHELTMVVTGVYGEPLLKQHGAPIRIIVPWKYGYKSPKSIVLVELLREQPKTFWQIQPHEYGFLSNVNPNIPHPRWSQTRSWWLDRQSERFGEQAR